MYLGIDWSQTKHDACFLTDTGSIVARLTFAHHPDGFAKLDALRGQLGIPLDACCVGLETAHSLLVDWLWTRGYTHLFVIPPNAVKSARQRYRQTGARTDQYDAFVIADMLRTDQARLQPWYPDSPITQCIRAKVSLLLHLSQETTRTSNRLRAVLARYYPAALAVFRDLASPVALQFIQAFPTPQLATHLSRADVAAFVRARHYRQSEQVLTKAYLRLQRAYPSAMPGTIDAYQDEAVLLTEVLLVLVQRRRTQLQALQAVFQQHPDAPIFASLPGAGELLAPALLGKFGDDRRRFPTPSSVQCIAGTCPVTEASGKQRVIKFRKACDREFRLIAQQWARASLVKSTWANDYWSRLRPNCTSDSHAYRCLANRWLAIAWKLWQTQQPYDETYHLRQRLLRSQGVV